MTRVPSGSAEPPATTPHTSWPGAYGSVTNGCRPCHACVSDPQTPATTVRTSTSPGPGAGVGASVTSTPPVVTTIRRIVAGTVRVSMGPNLRAGRGGRECGHRSRPPPPPRRATPPGGPAIGNHLSGIVAELRIAGRTFLS